MDFTREPIIETVITPKEGCTLVVRSSKSSGQEEYFVDAIEVVIFGNAIFFRSRERPKAFLVPASDYEVLEVRETRLVLKNVGLDRSIKIGGGREAPLRHGRDIPGKSERLAAPPEKSASATASDSSQLAVTSDSADESASAEPRPEARLDKKRDRRRNYRRRRGKDDDGAKGSDEGGDLPEHQTSEPGTVELPPPHLTKEEIASSAESAPVAAVLSSLLAPPPNLISETIARYKDNALFKGAFFLKDDEEGSEEHEEGDKEGEALNEAPEAAHSEVLSDTVFDAEGIAVPTMSLDYPVYGERAATLMKESSDGHPMSQQKSFFMSSEESPSSRSVLEPSVTPQTAEKIHKERFLEATEEAFGAIDALEEERLAAEEEISKASVAAEDLVIGEQVDLKSSESPLEVDDSAENIHGTHGTE